MSYYTFHDTTCTPCKCTNTTKIWYKQHHSRLYQCQSYHHWEHRLLTQAMAGKSAVEANLWCVQLCCLFCQKLHWMQWCPCWPSYPCWHPTAHVEGALTKMSTNNNNIIWLIPAVSCLLPKWAPSSFWLLSLSIGASVLCCNNVIWVAVGFSGCFPICSSFCWDCFWFICCMLHWWLGYACWCWWF